MAKRGRPHHPDILTPREWEVHALLREGLSNQAIAERLSISLAGAKYHVSEILSKLGVASREEAAAWTREQRPWWQTAGVPLAWFRGGLRDLTASGVAGLGNGLAAVAFVLVLTGLGLVAFFLVRDGSESPPNAVSSVPVTDLFTDPRPREPDERRELPSPRESSFGVWDGVSTLLYDTQTGEALNLGEGELGRFSLDGRWMAWTGGPPGGIEQQEVWAIELATLERRSYGAGRFLRFVDEDLALVRTSSQLIRLDLASGAREPIDSAPTRRTITPDGYELQRIEPNVYVLTDPRTEETLLEFEAYKAVPAGPGELAVATVPLDDWMNIFLVDIAAKRAMFVETVKLTVHGNWPFAATEDLVIWTEDYCNFSADEGTRIYERESGRLIELNESLWVTLTPGGLIASGSFGAKELIEPETLERIVVVPQKDPQAPTATDVAWSPDYRYFSQGYAGGHGGLCP